MMGALVTLGGAKFIEATLAKRIGRLKKLDLEFSLNPTLGKL